MFAPGPYRVAADLLRITKADGDIVTFSWGDWLKVAAGDATGVDIELDGATARVKKPAKDALVPDGPGAPRVLRMDFVDVQQGDATLMRTPGGKTVVIDGGRNQLFARYLAARNPGTSATRPRRIDCMVVSHGDADHFAGRTEIFKSERLDARRRLFLAPRRIFHNGLVKGPESPQLGRREGGLLLDLHDDVRELPNGLLNTGFRAWRDAVKVWAARDDAFEMRRLQRGDDAAFDFLRQEYVHVQVLGPTTVEGGLPWLGSVGESINGHSVVLLVRYGNVRFLLAGDLNTAAEKTLVESDVDLRAEVLKVPHHGSADYLPEFLQRVEAGVSIVSSGDEGSDYIHPRATLVGALGRFARPQLPRPVLFITELAAFFRPDGFDDDGRFKLTRDAFGIVRCRTNGQRLLVYTDSGIDGQHEAYAFTVAKDGKMAESRVRTTG